MSKRELDLGRLMQKVGRRIEDDGQATSQKLYDWRRVERIETDSTRGGGGVSFDLADRQQDRHAARMSAEWVRLRQQAAYICERLDWLMSQAKAEQRPLDKHRTPAQVEADGWCGNCWKHAGQLVPIAERPSGEPYYRGRCRACGSWPGGDPPAEVVRARVAGKAIRVAAS